jgi:hypothetical protein
MNVPVNATTGKLKTPTEYRFGINVPLRGLEVTIHINIRHENKDMSPKVLIPWIVTPPQALATLPKL